LRTLGRMVEGMVLMRRHAAVKRVEQGKADMGTRGGGGRGGGGRGWLEKRRVSERGQGESKVEIFCRLSGLEISGETFV